MMESEAPVQGWAGVCENIRYRIRYQILLHRYSVRYWYTISYTDKYGGLWFGGVLCVYCAINCVLKGYLRCSLSLQRNGKAFQSPVKVFWIEVQPIWNSTQELMDWSRINIRELACRIILVHIITMIVKVHFTIFIAVTGRRTSKTWSCIETLNHISISISYTISYTILRTLQKDALWALDIDTISKKNRRYRLRFSNSTVFGTRY